MESTKRGWGRIVVKVGTSTLTAGTPRLNPPRMVSLARQIRELTDRGAAVILVTSGAQQAGREHLNPSGQHKSIPFKQMLAAVGQSRLMSLWERYFELYDLTVAQILLTRQDIEDRLRYLNVRDTFNGLLQRGIVPVINENDAVATDEIRVGENDSLAAMVANLIEADLLILLTDTDGLYTADPSEDPAARLIERVQTIDEGIYQLAHGSRSGMGSGGMYTKIAAAEIAVHSGTTVAIANGSRENVLAGLLDGAVPATWFPVHITPAEGRQRWMLAQSVIPGTVYIDDGACQALTELGRSLLPVGIHRVEGTFSRGEIISVRNGSGREIARGLANYGSDDLQRIMGQQSGRHADILGYDYGPEFIHRNNMAVI
ncbi:MAG: glutamate 5-kinase [Chloroflexi bacterium]|nr:glutamate 5-kinase [Chloroflexota bacterium]